MIQIEPLADADRVLLLRNRRAGSGANASRLDQFVELLGQRGIRTEVIDSLAQLPERSAELAAEGVLRSVIAAGGDGTAELVVNAIPEGLPLLVFPLGTENLLAKYLGLGPDPHEMARIALDGQVVHLDAGAILTGEQAPHLFLLMLGCGFDADVIHRLHRERTGHIKHWSYAKPILESIRSYDYPQLKVSSFAAGGDQPLDSRTAHWVFLFNTPSYAAGLGICPEASPFDGQLDLVTFQASNLWQGLFHLSAVVLGQHRQLSGVHVSQAASFRIEADGQVPYQVDGDPGGYLPVEVTVMPGRLRVVVPADWLTGNSVRTPDAS